MSWVDRFRERPRAVVILPCAEATLNATSCDVHDARHWVAAESAAFALLVVLQGRIDVGDWVRVVVKSGRETVGAQSEQVRQTLGKGVCQLRFEFVPATFPHKGLYTLEVECNGRLAGRANLELL
jgi:hypothetical protein